MADLGELRRRLGIPRDGEARYALGEELGRGAFGRVVSAEDRDLDRAVAIKALAADPGESPADAEAFLAEAMITGRLEHPNIVPAYDVGVHDELGLYYTMKRHGGRSLRGAIDDLELGPALDVFAQICRAVAHAHRHGVVHADLKPENVLLGDRGEVQVGDWGVAFRVDDDGRPVGGPRPGEGSLRYMAPEQITEEFEALDHRIDVWSLGVMLYELLTKRVPFDGPDEEDVLESILTDRVEPPSRLDPSIPEAIDAICLGALTKSRSDRYPTVDVMLDELEAELAGRREQQRRKQIAERAVRAVDVLLEGADLDAYALAADHLVAGLELVPDHAALLTRAGTIYWRVFEDIYPGGATDQPQRALALLAKLTEHALGGVVRAKPDQLETGDLEDPWLSLVRRLTAGERVQASQAPPALLRLVRRIELLDAAPIFASLPSHRLLTIAEACDDITLAANETLFETGDESRTLYIVIDGTLRAERAGRTLSTMEAGEVFGEIALFGGHRRTATVIAETDASCLALDGAKFSELVEHNGDIALAVLKVLSARLEAATRREAERSRDVTRPVRE